MIVSFMGCNTLGFRQKQPEECWVLNPSMEHQLDHLQELPVYKYLPGFLFFKPTSWSKMLVDGMPMPWDIERMGPTLYIAYLPHIWRKKTTTCGQRFWQPGGENRSGSIFGWFLTCGNARWCQEDMCLWVKINFRARGKRHLNFHHTFFLL